METPKRPDTIRAGPLESLLDREEIAERSDDPGPGSPDDVVDLTWTQDDAAHAGTVAAAASGDLTPDETLADVASSLGYLERTIDEDDYDR